MAALLGSWNFEPPVVIAALAGVAAYAAGVYRYRRWNPLQALSYIGGIAAVVIALASPIDLLAEHSFLSAHMIQHVLLLFVAPPLVAWAAVGMLPERRSTGSGHGKAGKGLLLAAVAMLANLYIWHLPALYQGALEIEPVHDAEHLLYLVTGLLLWWQIFQPAPAGMSTVQWAFRRLLVLLGTSLAMMPLGLIFLILPFPAYSAYVSGGNAAGVLSTATTVGAALADQQLAALYMLASGGGLLSATLILGWAAMSRKLPALPVEHEVVHSL